MLQREFPYGKLPYGKFLSENSMTLKVTGPLIYGSTLSDQQYGTDAGDIFVGGYDTFIEVIAETVHAGDGDDLMFGSSGADVIHGGAGVDTVDYSGALGGVTVDLVTGQAFDSMNNDTIDGVENIAGSAYADNIKGDAGFNLLVGNGGNDTIDGGAGFDFASYRNATGNVVVSLATGTAQGADGDDVLSNIEAVQGSAWNDRLGGDAAGNLLDGGAGNDTLEGGGGNDSLTGGSGDDTAVFTGNLADYAIVTGVDGRVTVTDGVGGRDGSDMLYGIGHLQFADQTIHLAAVDRAVGGSGTGAPAQSAARLVDGSYVIGYRGSDADGDGILFRKFGADGTAIGDTGAVNTSTAGSQAAPSVIGLYDGGWVAAYQSTPAGGNADIVVQRFSADGSKNGAETRLISAGDQVQPSVAATVDGGFVVVWQNGSTDLDIQAQKFGVDGAREGIAVTVNTNKAGQQSGAVVAEQDNGYLVAWQSDNGTAHKVAVQQYRWDGEAIGGELTVQTSGTVGSVKAATLYGMDGTIASGGVVSWIQDDGNAATPDDAVMVQCFDAAGIAVGAPITVASAGFQQGQGVTGLRDGSFLVTWDSLGTDGTSAVMARHYLANGSAAGAAFQVNQSPVQGKALAPSVTETSDGRVAVSWSVQAADGTMRVFHQITGVDGGAEFLAGTTSGQPPAAPQFTIEEVAPAAARSAMAPAQFSNSMDAGKGGGFIDRGVIEAGQIVVDGSADAGASITLYDAGLVVGTTRAGGDGSWSIEFAKLSTGAHSFSATATDALGQVSAVSAVVAVTIVAPVISVIDGTVGNDAEAWFLEHGAGENAQTVNAGAGNDTINGGGGADTLNGGAGNDTFLINNAGVTVVELAKGGTDSVIATVDVTLAQEVENLVLKGDVGLAGHGNALNNVVTGGTGADSLYGEAGNDTLVGGEGNDLLDGGAGNDAMTGGAGDDTYVVDARTDIVTEVASVVGIDTVRTSLAAYALGAGVEQLAYTGEAAFTGTGNALDNVITGGIGADRLDGGAGNDTLDGNGGKDSLTGGAGDDVLRFTSGAALLDGGANGTPTGDTAVLARAFEAYTRVRLNDTDLKLTGPDGESVVVRGIEQFLFDGDVTKTWAEMTGDIAGPGAQTLSGSSGDDTLDGGAGSDRLVGGAGNDTYIVDVAGDEAVEQPGEGVDTVQVAFTAKGTYTLGANVEHAIVTPATATAINVTGNALGNALTGNGAINALLGMDGDDTLDGAAGNDALDGGAGNDSLAGGVGNDNLLGGAGDDTLDGGAGNDVMAGGAGDDVYIVDGAGDKTTEAAAAGVDSVRTTLATYTLAANVENLLYAGAAAFTGTGNAESNVIDSGSGAGNDRLNGGIGDDTLAGHAGNDTLDGGVGNDTAVLDLTREAYTVSALVVGETLFTTAGGARTILKNIENVRFGDVTVTLAELLAGKATVGNDVMTGTVGVDLLDGGAGADTMSGLTGNDVYVLDNVGDAVVEAADEGIDTARVAYTAAGKTYVLEANVEHAVVSGTVATSLTGNALDNELTGNAAANTLSGDAGNDLLAGMAGNDNLQGGAGDDTLDGGIGNDAMAGGSGNDTYHVDAAGDTIAELAGAGQDVVYSTAASYTLKTGVSVEWLEYAGTGSFTGSGNEFDNVIVGLGGADRLTGGAGADTLVGGAGNDALTGGIGADHFRLDLASLDTIADFVSGTDIVELDVGALMLGDGGAVQADAPGAFSADAALVLFTANASALNAKSAALVIGSASSDYELGQHALFVIDNGASTAIFRFQSSGTDAIVSAAELTQVATLTGVKAATLADFDLFSMP